MRLRDVEMSDFFDSTFGDFPRKSWRSRRFGRVVDTFFDFAMDLTGARNKIALVVNQTPRFRILVTGVAVPKRAGGMDAVVSKLRQSKHEITVSIVPMADAGKFENLNSALVQAGQPLENFDWIIATDDDVGLPANFLDQFIALAHAGDLKIAQPAHRFWSYCSWWITQRHWGSLVRRTKFVEIGPLNAFHRDAFSALMPFPPTRWCFGLDAYWTDLAHRHGWKIGIVDGTPIEHQRPPMESYGFSNASNEGREFLKSHNVTLSRRDLMVVGETVKKWI
jgi:hypothetical protein